MLLHEGNWVIFVLLFSPRTNQSAYHGPKTHLNDRTHSARNRTARPEFPSPETFSFKSQSDKDQGEKKADTQDGRRDLPDQTAHHPDSTWPFGLQQNDRPTDSDA